MSFTFEMGIKKGVLAIDIYDFIRASQNDMLIYIAMQLCSHEYTQAFNALNRENTGQM